MLQRIALINLPDLAESAPTKIAVACVFNVGLGECLETARRVKPSSDLIGNRFVLDEAVLTCRLNRFLIEVHRVKIAAFDASDLRQNKIVLVKKCSGATLNPFPEPL